MFFSQFCANSNRHLVSKHPDEVSDLDLHLLPMSPKKDACLYGLDE